MPFPPRRARIVMLAGVATLGVAGTASASTAVYTTDTNQLQITVDGTPGTDTVTCEGGNVKFNGADPQRVPPTPPQLTTGCAASASLVVNEPDKDTATANTLDLRGITRAEWTGLAGATTPFAINLGGGDDTVIGSEFAEVITPGKGNDNVNANAGNDTMVWNPGEASDVMTGGDGRDTVIDNGGGVDEQFVIKPKAGDPTRVDASRINNPFTLDIDAEKLVMNGAGGNDTITGNAGVGALIATEINGGDGNDTLVGTDGNDVMKGGAGIDSVTGAKGNDNMAGDDGDDTLIWNPGDGSDKFEGGAGNDIAQDNGGAAAEHFVVSGNGARFTATRDDNAPFFLDIGTTETLDLNTAGGDDSVDVNDGLGAVKVDADLGEGNDSIRARNDTAQTIDGGAGTDSARVDATDQVTNVESVKGAGGAKPKAKVRARVVVSRGRARVRFTLPKGESESKGRIRILRGGNIVGQKRKIEADGGRSTFRVKLKRSVRIALARDDNNKLKARVKVKLTDADGNTAVGNRKVKLVQKKG